MFYVRYIVPTFDVWAMPCRLDTQILVVGCSFFKMLNGTNRYCLPKYWCKRHQASLLVGFLFFFFRKLQMNSVNHTGNGSRETHQILFSHPAGWNTNCEPFHPPCAFDGSPIWSPQKMSRLFKKDKPKWVPRNIPTNVWMKLCIDSILLRS